MKRLLTLTTLLLLSLSSKAQVIDTVLYENFQVDHFDTYQLFALGNDTTWVNIDEDGLNPNDGDDNHRAWYFETDFQEVLFDSITGEMNTCAGSYSYMENSDPGNRNWLITPPVNITNANYTLHWKSNSYQLPRYLDGYLVMASTQNVPETFVDTLFQGASMIAITGDGESLDLSNFTFTNGYLHSDGLQLTQYYSVASDSSLAYGYFEPHSVSLAQYAGQSIYLGFLHNSDDDYYFSIDDILVVSTTTSGTNAVDEVDYRFVTYPNPVQNFLNVMYRLPKAATVSLQVTDISGKIVAQPLQNILQSEGEQQANLDLRKLPASTYAISLTVEGQTQTKMFVKK